MLSLDPSKLLLPALLAALTATAGPSAFADDDDDDRDRSGYSYDDDNDDDDDDDDDDRKKKRKARSFEFSISEDRVVPRSDFAAQTSVIGAAISDGKTDYPVTMGVAIDGEAYEPFGASADPNQGNVNTHETARHVIIAETFDEGTVIDIAAASWNPYTGKAHIAVNTSTPSDQVIVLRNGDAVPAIEGVHGQKSITSFLAPYLNSTNGTVKLSDDQIIYLFELGTTNMSSSAADFQDLVVIITLGDNPEALERRASADLLSYD